MTEMVRGADPVTQPQDHSRVCALGYVSTPPPYRQQAVMPLADFPHDRQEEIVLAVYEPSPPYKWLHFTGAMMESRAWYEWHWHRGIDPDKKRPSIPAATRKAVISRDGLWCRLCGDAVAADDVHIDHIKPWSLGGSHDLENLQVTHSRCNIRKGAN